MATDDQMREMDNAAADAKKELFTHLEEWKVKEVAAWWATWYLKAGHKRLGRLLVELAKQTPK
ncbi:MAG TPA: hypothetical protein VGQ11_06205 [Candidatus Acidoferrales bacterium]|jgi:hypothetical protein|nr:hypothetical protein [Candidatus Acidoferrales bacterium]